MTNRDRFNYLISIATDPADKARLAHTRDNMSPSVAKMEFLPYGEFEKPKLEELEVVK